MVDPEATAAQVEWVARREVEGSAEAVVQAETLETADRAAMATTADRAELVDQLEPRARVD
jgi:hypothetical protein